MVTTRKRIQVQSRWLGGIIVYRMYVSGGVFLYCITAVEVMLTGRAVEQISNPQEKR